MRDSRFYHRCELIEGECSSCRTYKDEIYIYDERCRCVDCIEMNISFNEGQRDYIVEQY